MSPQIQAIIFVVVAFFAGYAFGLFDKRFTATLRGWRAAGKPAAGDVNPANQTGGEAASADVLPVSQKVGGEQTVLKVGVDSDLKWHVELDGKRLESPDEMSPEQRQRAVGVVMQIRPWLAAAAEKSVAAAPVVATANPVTSAPAVETLQPQRAAPEPAKPASVVQVPAKRDDLRISPLRGLNSLITKDVKAAAEKKPASIVAMIDDVLQSRLPGTSYKDKGIRLEDGALGEVLVVRSVSTRQRWFPQQRYLRHLQVE